MIKLICFLVSVAVIVRATWAEDEPVVKTSTGPVKGYQTKSYEGRTVTAFEGIPYAKPPVGDLRFKEPQPVESWKDTLEASKTYTCMQYTAYAPVKDDLGDEDCLYLYIYVPKETIKGDENLPVVVHIHGGAFTVGDPKSVAGPEYIMDRDVIYVSMNYRLGVLGFLSTQDLTVSGNNGLKDQALAMSWIKKNIKHFGGNPNSITLTGASSGGASAHLHYFSPLSTGLFNRGLSQGGTALNSWSLTKNSHENALKMGTKFNCTTKDTKDMVDCLRDKPAKDVVLAQGDFYVFINSFPAVPFGPVLEYYRPGAFLPDHPYKLLLEGRINDCPWITSNVKDEGVVPVGYFLLGDKLEELDRRWDELSPYTMGYNETALEGDKTAIARAVRNHYLKGEHLSYKNINQLIQLFTDRLYLIDAIKAVTLQATVSRFPIYYYFFEYHTDIPVDYKLNLTAVAHGDDYKLMYHHKENPAKLSDSDSKMKDIFIDFLYEYASKGVPSFNGNHWKPVNSFGQQISYMHIFSPDTIRRESSLNLEPFVFWHSLPLRENEHLFKYVLNTVQYLPIFY